MPRVGNKHYPYTKEGYARAAAAKSLMASKKKKAKKKTKKD